MKGTIRLILGMILIAAGIAGCGGGGASGTVGGKAITAARMPYSATGPTVAGLQMTINIPLGITVQLDHDSGQVAKSVVHLSGATDPANALVTVDYVPATSSKSGKLEILVADPAGFTVSENVTIQLDVTPGFNPKPSDFSISDFIVSDIDGNTVSDLSPTFTVVIY